MLKSENFVYWLQGFFEISGVSSVNEEQVKVIKEHLEMCFEKVKPNSSTITLSPGQSGGNVTIPWTNLPGVIGGVGSLPPGTLIC